MKTKITPTQKNGKRMWLLTVHHGGKRRRKFFHSFAEASGFDVVDWLHGMKRVETFGEDTLVEVAVERYVHDYQSRYPESKTQQLEQRLNYLAQWFPGPTSELDVQEIARKIEEQKCRSGPNKGKLWSKSTRQTIRNVSQIFLEWCTHKGLAPQRDWKIKTLNVKAKPRQIGILNPDESVSLLMEINPVHQPAMALMLFTGIRPEGEMSRLTYGKINWGKWIEIPGDVAKWGERTLHDLPENLWSWLPKKRSGKVMTSWSALNQSRRRACSRLGFKYPADGARHSFATYGYWFKGMEWTMHTMGHANYNTFQRFYRNKQTNKEISEKYFSVVKNA
jgi:hypothetical protein